MSEHKKIKTGVIGTGVLGRFHTKLYRENPNTELIGVFDVSAAAAEKVGKEFGVPAFSSAEELASWCDALSVAVPATLHYSTAMPLIGMGKHLLVEKPIAATVQEAEEMVAAAAAKNLVFGVGHVVRFKAAMDFIEAHRSNPLFIDAQRLAKYPPSRPGMHRRGTEVSVVLDLMIHDLDLVLDLVDSEVERFDAVGMPVLSETEDIANVRIQFKNGTVANISASRVSLEPVRRVRVFQNDSFISMEFSNGKGCIARKSCFGIGVSNVALEEKDALAAELADFVNAVSLTKRENRLHRSRVPGEQGLRVLRLAVAISEQMRAYNQKYHLDRFCK